MEKMREVADAYYKAGAEDIKRLARDFFNSMDLNGDRRVILREYLAFTEKRGFIRMSNQEWFRKLDKDKKGSLGFNDVMTLCYIVKSGRPFCKGCGEFMSGVFFTCVKCFDSSPSCFSVCFQCYESGNIEHEHKEFLDNFALLEVKRRKSDFPELRATAGQVQILRKDSHPQGHDPMKELRQIAMAYCRTTSEDIKEKEKIRKLFSSMHYGNHERVALHEFLEFMRQKSYKHLIYSNLDIEFMNTPDFFRKLDKDKKGSLDFSDVKTLYYIIQSGRPFCKGCGEFMAGMFFTCVSCFERGGATFSLCLHCYNGQKFMHSAAHHLFLDNYALLEAVRETAWKAKKPKTQAKTNGLKQKSASLAMLLKVDSSEESTFSPGSNVSLNNKSNFTTKANTSSLSIVPVINKPSAAKAIASTANSLVKVIDKTTNAKDTFESFEAAMNMAIAAAMTITGFSAVCVIL